MAHGSTCAISPQNTSAEWLESELAASERMSVGKWKKPVLNDFHRRAIGALARGMGCGIYNVPANWKKAEFHPRYLRVVIRCTGWATFDFSELTRLVLVAHEESIRVDLAPKARDYMAVFFSPREREGSSMERHPTIEEAIARFREGRR